MLPSRNQFISSLHPRIYAPAPTWGLVGTEGYHIGLFRSRLKLSINQFNPLCHVLTRQAGIQTRHRLCVCRETLCSNESCNLWFNCSHAGHSPTGATAETVTENIPLIQLRHLQPLIGHWTCPSQSGLINGCDKWFRNSVMSYLQLTSILICQIIQLRHRKLTLTDTSVNESDCVCTCREKFRRK